MIGFGKLLLTIAVILVVWLAFKLGREGALRATTRRDRPPVPPANPSAGGASPPPSPPPPPEPGAVVADLVPCPLCGSFGVADRSDCGHARCPYGNGPFAKGPFSAGPGAKDERPLP